MRFTDLKSKQATLVETHIKQSSLLLENACIGLTKKQKQIVEGIHTEFKPLIEASLTGLPVIVTNVGGCSEVIHKCQEHCLVPMPVPVCR